MAVVKNLMVRAGADFSKIKTETQKAQKTLSAFKSSVSATMAGIGVALAGIGVASVSGAKDAMKFEALITTLGESLGDNIKDFEKWQETVGRSLGYSKLQAAELANMLSLNFKKIAVDQKDLADKTTKMMEVAALVANKRGMAMTEVSDRIRSAMNQEADGADELGVNVRANAIQQSKAYAQMSNGVPWEKLSTNMQKAILYHHILESVSTNLGDTIQNTTSMKMSVFSATLGDMRLALGQAWLPILSIALPALTKLGNGITSVLSKFAQLMSALFGYEVATGQSMATPTDNADKLGDSINGVGDAYKNAAKEAKKAQGQLAGFDEINTLAKKTDSGGSGGGVGGSTPDNTKYNVSKNDDSEGAIDKISNKVKKLSDDFKKWLEPLKPYWDNLKDSVKGFGKSIEDLWNSKAVKEFKKAFMEDLQPFFADLLLITSGAFDILSGSIDTYVGMVNGDFSKALQGAEKQISGLYDIITGTIGLVFPDLGKKMEEFGKKFGEKWSALKNEIKKNGNPAKLEASDFAEGLKSAVLGKIVGLMVSLGTKWDDIKTDASKKWKTITNAITFCLKDSVFLKGVGIASRGIFDKIKGAFTGAKKWFDDNVASKISASLGKIKDKFKSGITDGIKALLNTFIDTINKPFNTLKKISVLGKKPFSGLPTIPKLARGGIVDGATNFGNYIAGEKGKEMVVPLENTGFVDKLASALGTAVMGAMKMSTNGGSGDVVLNIDGRTFARAIAPYQKGESKRVGTTILKTI
jgi:hypothetical protein